MGKLDEIKERLQWGNEHVAWTINNIDLEDVVWLIEQAEKAERYEKALKEILDITEDTIELEVYTDIIKKALGEE
jgi:hypothetical protein